MRKQQGRRLATVVECIGIAVVGMAIGLELAFKAPVYLVAMGAGTVLFAVGNILYAKMK